MVIGLVVKILDLVGLNLAGYDLRVQKRLMVMVVVVSLIVELLGSEGLHRAVDSLSTRWPLVVVVVAVSRVAEFLGSGGFHAAVEERRKRDIRVRRHGLRTKIGRRDRYKTLNGS